VSGPPVLKRFKTNDCTVPKLQELLSQNPRGLLVLRDELVGLLSQLDVEEKLSDRAFYLECWNGSGKVTFDRIGRGSIFAPACLSVFGGIQPEPLRKYLVAAMRDGGNDGLVQRLQMLVYPDDIEWKYVDEKPDHKAMEKAFDALSRLVSTNFVTLGSQIDAVENAIPYFRFSDEAQEFFKNWLIKLEEKLTLMRASNAEAVLIEHLAKYRSLMPSLALLTHLLDVVSGSVVGDVSLDAAKKAAAWCEFLETHARRIYGLIGRHESAPAMSLAKKIREGRVADGFTARDIYRHEWSNLSKPEVQVAIDELIAKKWLREKELANSTRYEINPKLFTDDGKFLTDRTDRTDR